MHSEHPRICAVAGICAPSTTSCRPVIRVNRKRDAWPCGAVLIEPQKGRTCCCAKTPARYFRAGPHSETLLSLGAKVSSSSYRPHNRVLRTPYSVLRTARWCESRVRHYDVQGYPDPEYLDRCLAIDLNLSGMRVKPEIDPTLCGYQVYILPPTSTLENHHHSPLSSCHVENSRFLRRKRTLRGLSFRRVPADQSLI